MEQAYDDAQQQKQQAEEQKSVNNLQLSISSCQQYSKFSLLYNTQSSRPQSDLVCVVDISGSMSSEATIQNSDGDLESKGLTILDIVKHAVKTISANLTQNDRLALVAFDDRAEQIFGLTKMDQAGQTQALNQIDSLSDRGSTNLWDGIFQGLEVLRTQSQLGRNQAVLVFTDGMPNIVPPRGHIPMLKQYKEKYPDMKPVVHTFGFGYSMDSVLLDEIAQECGGIYAFIPDSSLVGTVFVNSLSNILPTIASNIQMNVELINGAKPNENPVLGNYQHLITSWGIQVDIGTLQEGQSKDIIFNLNIQDNDQPYAQVSVKYLDLLDQKNKQIQMQAKIGNQDQNIDIQRARFAIVDCIKAVFEAMKNSDNNKAQSIIKETNSLINSFQFAKQNPYVQDLLKDLNGQISEAVSRQDWFQKWGRHYLLSLMRAHLSQICNNFKDPGVQHYGGRLFKLIRDQADEIFLKLPPPKPSRQAYVQKKSAQGFAQKVQVQSQSVNMQQYYDARAGCFDGNCLIQMEDGNQKKICELTQGDRVKTNSINGDKIACIVQTYCKDSIEFVLFNNGLKITPYHPICINNNWHFPISVNQNIKKEDNATIYSIILENDYSFFVNGIECVSLGHNSQANSILQHPYFGSQKVIEDLKKMKGWENGKVLLKQPCIMRNQQTGLIERFIQIE